MIGFLDAESRVRMLCLAMEAMGRWDDGARLALLSMLCLAAGW